MKFTLASDLHLEFAHLDINNEEQSDVLVLAGDIFVAKEFNLGTEKANMYRRFIEEVTSRYSHVVYVMGNHEHYHGDYAKTADILKQEFKYFTNFKFLNNSFVDICDVRFIGGTLWTDLNKNDPVTTQRVKMAMNDYHIVENSDAVVSFKIKTESDGVQFKTRPAKFCPEDAYKEHKDCLAVIDEVLTAYQDDKKVIVVGHHLPTHKSVPERYRQDFHSNGGYASDLSEFILDRPRIKYWIHGHTHDACDYTVGDTRIICNPRGYYGHENCAYKFKVTQYEI